MFVCIFAVTEDSAPVIVTVLVTETPFVVNVIVATPATPPPVRVTVAAPPLASVPEHDWLVQVVTPAPAVSTPRVVLTDNVPPEIGALLLASTNVAVMFAVVPVEVTATAVVGEIVPEAGRPGTTVVDVVKVTNAVPSRTADPPLAGMMYTVTVALPAPVLGPRNVAVIAVVDALAAAATAEMVAAGVVVDTEGAAAHKVPAAPVAPTNVPLLVDTEIVSAFSAAAAVGAIEITEVLRPSPGMLVGDADTEMPKMVTLEIDPVSRSTGPDDCVVTLIVPAVVADDG